MLSDTSDQPRQRVRPGRDDDAAASTARPADPAAVATTDSSSASVTSCRAIRKRDAPSAARTESSRRRGFAARQHQVRDVRARQQQHQHHRPAEHPRAPAGCRRARSRAAAGRRCRSSPGCADRDIAVPAARRCASISAAAALDRRAGLEPRDAGQVMRRRADCAGRRGRMRSGRMTPAAALATRFTGSTRSGGSTPTTVLRAALDVDGAPDDRAGRAPNRSRHTASDRMTAALPGSLLVGSKAAAERRLAPEHVEGVGGDRRPTPTRCGSPAPPLIVDAPAVPSRRSRACGFARRSPGTQGPTAPPGPSRPTGSSPSTRRSGSRVRQRLAAAPHGRC